MSDLQLQPVYEAIEKGDFLRASALLEKLAVSPRDREVDDVVGAITATFAARGVSHPAGLRRAFPQVRKAVACLNLFLEKHDIKSTPKNRNILIPVLVKYTLDHLYVDPEGYDEEVAKQIEKYNKSPQYLRVLQLLSNVDRITAAVNSCFPGYLQSRNLHMFGIEYSKDVPVVPPTPVRWDCLTAIAAGFPPPDDNKQTLEDEIDKEEMEEAYKHEKMRERVHKQRPPITGQQQNKTPAGIDPATGGVLLTDEDED